MSKKAFYQTSEFWGLVIPYLLGILDAVGVVDLIPGQADDAIWSAILSVAAALGYGAIRIKRKADEDRATIGEAALKASPLDG